MTAGNYHSFTNFIEMLLLLFQEVVVLYYVSMHFLCACVVFL